MTGASIRRPMARISNIQRRIPSLLVLMGVLAGTMTVARPAPILAGPKATPKAVVLPPKLLTYVKAVYPESLQKRGLRGSVVLELSLDISGAVAKIRVVRSAGPDFDGAAVAAGKQLKFAPATRAGKPIAVRIHFRYRFSPEIRRRARARSLGRYDRRPWERAPSGFESFNGRVIERGTGRPVAACTVLIASQKREAMTDVAGRFSFGLLKAGKFTVQVSGAEHKSRRFKVTIADGKTTSRTLRVNRNSYVIYRATAVAPPEPGEMARRSISAEEIQRIPGVYGDAFKVVQNLPGVARPPAISGAIIVRGSAPGDTQINIEGVRVPILYHFGGLYSVVNTDILEGIDFYPGGYAVRYGRKTGGLLQARLKLAKDDAPFHGYIESNVFHTGFLISGAITKDIQVTLSARRSYIDLVLAAVVPDGALPFTLAPRYWDYQLKVDWRINNWMDASMLVLGSSDSLRAVIDRPPPGFGNANSEISTTSGFHGAIALLRMRGDDWKGRTTLGVVRTSANLNLLDQFRFDVVSWQTTLRQDFTFGSGPLQIRTGLDLFIDPFEAEVLLPPQAADLGEGADADAGSRQLQMSAVGVQPAVWFDAVFKLHKDLEVVPGIRLDLFRGQNTGQTMLPRINARYRMRPDLTLKGATGILSQPPAVQDVVDRFGNPNLLPFYSWETAIGAEWKPHARLDLDVQVFHKRLWDMIVQPRTPFEGFGNQNAGRGRIFGLEVLLRHPPVGKFFGWIAYTLMRGSITPHPGMDERLLDWDQTHIFTGVGSYKLPANWEVSARFRLVSGNPLTAVIGAIYQDRGDDWDPIRSACVNCSRLPPFHQLDLRVDKKFVFNSWMLGVYIDVQNVYNRANPERIQYNYDFTQKAYQSLLPIIPSFGIRGEF
ncbi:MAG: TonB-dependent receptor [Myxococcales bacterium]|nr:TonB-dependent receptor [Myxococcales bacterium]